MITRDPVDMLLSGRMDRRAFSAALASLGLGLATTPLVARRAWAEEEITESVPFSHYDIVSRVLDEVRDRGYIHLVVDDLGAGFSNLKRIVDLRPSVVKLDIKLVTGIEVNPRQWQLVQSIVELCRDHSRRAGQT